MFLTKYDVVGFTNLWISGDKWEKIGHFGFLDEKYMFILYCDLHYLSMHFTEDWICFLCLSTPYFC